MKRWLLDTDHISLQERGHAVVRDRLAAVDSDNVFVSVVSVEEMFRGRLAMIAKRSGSDAKVHAYRKFLETIDFVSTVSAVPFSSSCEERFQALRKQRLRVGSQDLRIAATALVNDMILVTRNLKDFGKIPGLMIEDWSIRQ